MISGFHGFLYTLARLHLFSDSCKNQDVGIHRHADRKDNTCNAGQSQSDLQPVQQDDDQAAIESQRNVCGKAQDPVNQ